MNTRQAQKLAREIARDLFTNGLNERADRLTLVTKTGLILGGWSEPCLRIRIVKHLVESK